MDDATLARVEEQRLQLEHNIAQLRKSLRYWQSLEIDYEGLKEEFLGLPENATSEQCLQAAKDFRPEQVDDAELNNILKDSDKGHRKPSQLVDLFTKRSEYVLRNVETIRKQLSALDKKRNALLLAENPEYQEDAGLPLKEITEELDEDGEVISHTVQAPGENASKLVDVLRKAGVTDLKDGTPSSNEKITAEDGNDQDDKENTRTTGVEPLPTNPSGVSTGDQGDHILEDRSEISILGPTNPEDTDEDAVLRQEMLQYGLGEVGAIVAELDMQENASDDEYDKYDEDEDELDFDDDEDEELYSDESEDERGAAKVPVMSDRYVRKMESLQKKFGIKDLHNLGPAPDLPEAVQEQLNRPPAAEAARQAALARAEAETVKSALKQNDETDETSQKPKRAKTVAFAESLDIAQESPQIPPAKTSSKASESKEPEVNPVGDFVVERDVGSHEVTPAQAPAPAPAPTPGNATQTKKVSKFKASRTTTTTTPQTPMFPPPIRNSPPTSKPTPQGPVGKVISHQLVERPAATTDKLPPKNPSDFDEELHRREVAIEFQKLRNRKIHEQGGYVRGGEQENYGDDLVAETVTDELTGKPRKVSRFKAARINNT